MFKSNKSKIVDEIVKVSKQLFEDSRYDDEDVKFRQEHLDRLLKALELIS